MDTKTDLKALVHLLAEKEHPDDCGNSNGHYPSKECITIRLTHERAILPFLELLVEASDRLDTMARLSGIAPWVGDPPMKDLLLQECAKAMEMQSKINAILDQH